MTMQTIRDQARRTREAITASEIALKAISDYTTSGAFDGGPVSIAELEQLRWDRMASCARALSEARILTSMVEGMV